MAMVAQWRISGGGSGATRLLLLIFVLCSCSIISVAPKRDSAASSSHHLLQGHGHEPNPDKGGGGGLYPPRENREKKDGDGGLSTKSGKARKEEEVEGVEENGWRRLIGNKTRSGAATTATDEVRRRVIPRNLYSNLSSLSSHLSWDGMSTPEVGIPEEGRKEGRSGVVFL